MTEAQRPAIYQETAGIQESYVQGLFGYYNDLATSLSSISGDTGRVRVIDLLPQTREHMLSFIVYMHHSVEETMTQLEAAGVAESDLHELLYQHQMRWKFDHDELTASEREELQSESVEISDLQRNIFNTIKQSSQSVSEEQKIQNEQALVRPADVHDLSHVVTRLLFYDNVPRSLKDNMMDMVMSMRFVTRLLGSMTDEHPALYNVATIITRGVASQWSNYLKYVIGKSDNEAVIASLQEAKSVFNSMLDVSEPESIELTSFLESQIEYLKAAGHRHDADKRIAINVQDERTTEQSKQKQFVLADRGRLITLFRNLVEDAVIHGDYEDDTINIDISITPPDENAVTKVCVSNPVWNTKEALAALCERLGNERVVFDTEGNVVTLDMHEMSTSYGLHGLGKLSVALTTKQTLAQAGFSEGTRNTYVNKQWSYSEKEADNAVESDEKKWFNLTCAVPLPKAA